MKKSLVFYILLAVLVTAFISAGWFLIARVKSGSSIDNVVLISIDTCRADYLSCYGYPRETTPNIDQLAAEGIRFENVISPVPLTLPGHSSMLTGTIPVYHSVHDNIGFRLGQEQLTLAEILRQKGFRTGAVISAFVLDSQFGMDQGFDSYNDHFEKQHKAIDRSERLGDETSRVANEWIEQNKEDNFFLFVHYYDPHYQYVPPEPFASKFGDSPYAGEIAFTDHCIGQVLDKLKELGLYDSTLMIITSDHGETLGEYGEQTHSYYIYQSAIKVPLIFRLPNMSSGKTVKDLVGLVDIVPTVCNLLDIEVPGQVQGKDLSHAALGIPGEEPDSVYLQILGTGWPSRRKWLGLWRGVRTRRYTYARWKDRGGMRVLYDQEEDPLEMRNLIGNPTYAEVEQQMEKRLQCWIRETNDPFDTGKRLPVTEMLDLGQAFSTKRWHQNAPAEYVKAMEKNHLNFRTGERPD